MMNSSMPKWLIYSGVSLALIIIVAASFLYRVYSGIESSVQHKSAKTSTATIVSITEVHSTSTANVSHGDPLVELCFSIDNFDQIEADMRHGYQSAEEERLNKEGPRCKVTTKVSLAEHLTKGDKLSVVYLEENEYRIDVAAVTAFGENL